MTGCEPCAERRRKLLDALLEAKIAEAVKHAALGAAEMVGLKEKEHVDGDELSRPGDGMGEEKRGEA